MRKRTVSALLCALLLLCACAACRTQNPPAERGLRERPLRIAVASDLHYLSPQLTDNGPFFRSVVERGDGKLMLDIEAVTEAFVMQMISEAPDLLILSGDLTFSGAYQSHADLADKLRRIEEAGVQVLVLPGNHDLRSSSAARFEGESYEAVRSISANEFRELYADFGPAGAASFDEDSFSYAVEPRQGLRIILLDTNSAASNTLTPGGVAWLEKQLKSAKRNAERVITVSHQNLLVHNSLFSYGYQIGNSAEICELLRKYGVMAHLSGHMHIQHLLVDGFPELLTAALPLYPCRYGMLVFDGETLRYEARSVDVSAWAETNGLTDEKYLDFNAYARDAFYRHFYRQISEASSFEAFQPEDRERMARCFADVNLAYFTGEGPDRSRLERGLAFWEETAGESFHTAYLRGILTDDAPNPLETLLWQRERG